MEAGDYIAASDLLKFSEEQYHSLVLYLKLIGITCNISYIRIVEDVLPDEVIMNYCHAGTSFMVWANDNSPFLKRRYSYEDLKRMASLGGLT